MGVAKVKFAYKPYSILWIFQLFFNARQYSSKMNLVACALAAFKKFSGKYFTILIY